MLLLGLAKASILTQTIKVRLILGFNCVGSKNNLRKGVSKPRSDSNTKSMSKNSRNTSVKNLKANTTEKNPDIPTVEFDFSNSTIEHGPPTCPSQPSKPSMFSRKGSFRKYITPVEEEKKSSVINNFDPTKADMDKDSDTTLELAPQKLEAVKQMHKIIKNHILMNSMIRWIENGFMHLPENAQQNADKSEILEYSSIEKSPQLYPITEESIGDLDNDPYSSGHKAHLSRVPKLDKLRRAIEIGTTGNERILLLKAFKEWKRLGIKMSLEKLLEYRQALDRLQAMPMSEEEYYYEGEESEVSQG
jgi:hypothetical protein